MTTWIAEELFVAVYPDGRRVDGRIAIGVPTLGDGEYRCEVVTEPFRPRSREGIGDGTLESLVTALRLAGWSIAAFLESGGRLVDRDTGGSIAIEAVMGPLLRE